MCVFHSINITTASESLISSSDVVIRYRQKMKTKVDEKNLNQHKVGSLCSFQFENKSAIPAFKLADNYTKMYFPVV